VLNDKLLIWLREGESEHLAFRLFFGHETIETSVAFANLHGGILLLGISELREIKGVTVSKKDIEQWQYEIQTRTTPQLFPHIEIIEIEEKTVVCISVAEYPMKPVAFEGNYYKRTGKFNQELSADEAIDFRQQLIDSGWDTQLRPDKTIAGISFKKLFRQIERISRKKQCTPEEPLTFLRKYGLTVGNAITNACRLLFLPDEESDATTIELGRFSSPTVTSDTLTLKDDLFTEAESAIRFICKHISTEEQQGESQWRYPLEAIRELVVNMIVHRDYTSDYPSIVKIFDGYIEFYNSGALHEDLSVKQLLSDGYVSRPRNCQIAELFKDAGMSEEYGYGIRKIHSAFVDKGLRPPEFIRLPGRLIVRVFGEAVTPFEIEKHEHKSDPVPENADAISDIEPEQPTEETGADFSSREQQIIAFIHEDNRIALNEIAHKLNISKRTVLRDLKKMKQGKIIERIGNEKNGYWEITSKSFS
jgi:ATP-dependent DNA helicase RecG